MSDGKRRGGAGNLRPQLGVGADDVIGVRLVNVVIGSVSPPFCA